MIDEDPAFREEFLDIAIRESVAQVPADREDDHVWREPEPLGYEARGGRDRTTTTTTLHRQPSPAAARTVNATEPSQDTRINVVMRNRAANEPGDLEVFRLLGWRFPSAT